MLHTLHVSPFDMDNGKTKLQDIPPFKNFGYRKINCEFGSNFTHYPKFSI